MIHSGPSSWIVSKTLSNSTRGTTLHFLDKLLSIFETPEFEFCSFRQALKPRMEYARLLANRSDGDSMSARFTRDFIDVEKCVGNQGAVLYNIGLYKVPWRQILIARDDDLFLVFVNLKARMETVVYFIL